MSEKIEIYKPVIKQEDADFIKNRLNCGTSKVDTAIDWISYAQFAGYKNKRKNLVSKAIFINDWEIKKPIKYLIKSPIGNNLYVSIDSIFFNEKGIQKIQKSFYWGNSFEAYLFTKAEINKDEFLKRLTSVCELVKADD